MDPLIKSEPPDACNERDEHERKGICEDKEDHERRLTADGTGHVGTSMEPEQRVPVGLVRRRAPRAAPSRCPDPRRVTYAVIRAYVYSRHGFSPRTGWIAHVKERSGLALRPTHNRRGATRADPCPTERWAAVEAALRHFGIL